MSQLFPGFTPFSLQTSRDPPITIHGLQSGSSSTNLPPLLLVHGFPQSYHIWHRIAPKLTEEFNVVLIDIRGYGASSKPADVACYAKSAMARDCIQVMDQLGYTGHFSVCAHDRGARVTHKLCVDYPDRVKAAILLDICPTLAMYTATDFDFAKAYFHWFFLIQQEPLPETLISASPRAFANMFMGGRQTDGLRIFDEECFEYYQSVMEKPEAIHSMCQDYRASATLDLNEAREDIKLGRLIRNPLLVLWGKHGVIEKCFDAVKEWQAVAAEGVTVRGHAVESGHYIPEQTPDEVLKAIREFLV
ncbi:Alpha/Beta hydrolase protein [Emericellopsis atlantica]|uniref:Alpha/Beta hydrolase protein n=1 Tax=Emericellopsis atlantica TaxID=2614577 RepID=A0A9P7ZIA9_9HYPO|nr:Alpha/Beta hydrolase protein [Emericellopsis atlantica]KAG9252634.1 Alpha/Beta hydrolase protein [Emericellopsis atlantica]